MKQQQQYDLEKAGIHLYTMQKYTRHNYAYERRVSKETLFSYRSYHSLKNLLGSQITVAIWTAGKSVSHSTF